MHHFECCGGSVRASVWLFAVFTVAGLGLIAAPVRAISMRHDVPQFEYIDLGAQFPAVGRVDYGSVAGHCSGTLVAPELVLTAAHCGDGIAGPLDNVADIPMTTLRFKLGNDAGSPTHSVRVSSIDVNNWNGASQFDMALMTLRTAITDVIPATLSSQDSLDQLGTMVGFGEHGTGLFFPQPFDNLKRAAQNMIDRVTSTLRTDFDHPNGTTNQFGSPFPVALEGSTGGGDSGGPLAVDFGGGQRIVGVLSGGFNDVGVDSEYGDISIWAAVANSANISFLTSRGLNVGSGEAGDFDGNGLWDCDDLDALTGEIADGGSRLEFDITGDGAVDRDDLDQWLIIAGGINLGTGTAYLPGDANLDGVVDAADFNVWNNHKFALTARWCEGDLNADGVVDASDYNLWNSHKFTSSTASASPPADPLGASLEDAAFGFRPGRPQIVAEPSSLAVVVLALILSRLRPRHVKLHEFAEAK